MSSENIYLDIVEKQDNINNKEENESDDEYVYESQSESSDEDIQLTDLQQKKFDSWVQSEKNNEQELHKLKKNQEKRTKIVADLVHKKMEKQKKEEEYAKNSTKRVIKHMGSLMMNLQRANQTHRNKGYNKYAIKNINKRHDKNKVALFKMKLF